MKHFSTLALFGISILLSSCIADIRTRLLKTEGLTGDNEKKGRAILERTWKKHGFDQFASFSSYSFEGKDVWKGLRGKMGKSWPEAQSDILFKYAARTFDAKALFKNGKRENTSAGLQSWNYYEIDPNGKLEFKKMNYRIRFGISAVQYFLELPDRLRQAPIISYGGHREFKGGEYDIVFATWEKLEPHMEHDQYQLWINRETGLLDFSVYTIRENWLKMPGYKMFYGSIEFGDYRRINGVLIPHELIVYVSKPKKKASKHLRRLNIENFQFDSFEVKELYPDPTIKSVGDSKEVGKKMN